MHGASAGGRPPGSCPSWRAATCRSSGRPSRARSPSSTARSTRRPRPAGSSPRWRTAAACSAPGWNAAWRSIWGMPRGSRPGRDERRGPRSRRPGSSRPDPRGQMPRVGPRPAREHGYPLGGGVIATVRAAVASLPRSREPPDRARRVRPVSEAPGMSSSAYPSSTRQHAGPDRLPPAVLTGRWGEVRYEVSKRLLDVAVSATLLIVGLPLLIAIAVGIKLSGPGPILFKQRRLGRGGTVFWCYKFRTMVPDAEAQLAARPDIISEFANNYKLKYDHRITRFGACLRRTSLDELPQLWNVLRGEMSLVGPRPIVEPELSKYGGDADRLLTVKPGLGGIWQVSGRSDTSYPERVAKDMRYIDSRSLWLDLKLLVLTALAVIRGRGAY